MVKNIKITTSYILMEKIIIIDNYKFDVTEFASKHPGGSDILKKFNGKDATKAFNEIKGHGESVVLDLLDKFCIGKNKID
jgi:cytochrome b involved in lipid metabolism